MLDTVEVIEEAISFPMDHIVKRYSEQFELTYDAAKEHELELKRYLALCAANSGVVYGMNGPVDELWHLFIIHTEEYSEFCNRVSNSFIHHIPTSEEDKSYGNGGERYIRFLDDYKEMFKSEPPCHIWPRYKSGSGPCSGCSNCSSGEGDKTLPLLTGGVNCDGCTGCNGSDTGK